MKVTGIYNECYVDEMLMPFSWFFICNELVLKGMSDKNNNQDPYQDDEGNIDTTTCPEVTLIYER